MNVDESVSRLRDSLRRALIAVAWTNVVLHIAGLFVALFVMRPGTAAFELQQRISYIATHSTVWGLAWTLWIVCAIGLTVFVSLLAAMHPRSFLARLALILIVVGVAFDITCDLLYVVVFPLAAQRAFSAGGSFADFEVLERAIGIGSLATANGFYSIAMLLLTCGLASSPAIRFTGYGTGICGLLMAVAVVLGSTWLIEAATGPTMLLFCVWSVLLARSVQTDPA